MPLFRRRHAAAPSQTPGPTKPAVSDVDPLAQYADIVTVVVRHTPEQLSTDPNYEVATVSSFAAGGDAPVEALREETLRWLLDEADFTAHNEYATRRRHISAGAAGAEAEIIVSLLGGAAGGVAAALTQQAANFIGDRLGRRTDHLEPLTARLQDLDGMRFAVSRAFDIRPSDLTLVEQRSSDSRHGTVFEDRGGRLYGVRVEDRGVTIRRLQPGDR